MSQLFKNPHLYPLILAGGVGTRLWPLSRRSKPKQLNSFFGSTTLLEQAYRNVTRGFFPRAVYVSTNTSSAHAVRALLPRMPRSNLIVEPVCRNTAAAIGYAAAVLKYQDPDAVIVTVNSDAWIGNPGAFIKAIEFAARIIKARTDHLVLLGSNPTYPETGYGYIEMGLPVMKYGNLEAFTVKSFTEKPTLSRAKQYLSSWRYLWNPTVMTIRADHLLSLYRTHLPRMFTGLVRISKALHTRNAAATVQREFRAFPPISIDYGIVEKLKKDILVIPAEFGWSDVGSYRTVHEIITHLTRKNVVRGKSISIDAENNLIFPETNKLVALIGVKNLVLVETKDALLLCHKERSQEVKKVVEMLKRKGMIQYL
ncbi:MAG: sugar phosphate nucleotidyltransferase [Patescibacteria group bacterium]